MLKWLFGSQAAADAAIASMAVGATTAAAGALTANALTPSIDNTSTTSTAPQYEPQDTAETDIAIGQTESTTSRKKKSSRGRTAPSTPTQTAAPTAPQATSTGLHI